MPVYKNEKTGTWYAMVRYRDWTGENKQKCQRGFVTKREALDWESQFKLQQASDIVMTLESFYELYEKDVSVVPVPEKEDWPVFVWKQGRNSIRESRDISCV